MLKAIIISTIVLCCVQCTRAQSVTINTDGSPADLSALFDVKSTDKGVLIPRMTKGQRNLISAPAAGLLVFQSAPDSIGFYYYNGNKWSMLLNAAAADSITWKTNGNTSTNPTNNFLGTIDSNALVIKTNNVERMRLMPNAAGFVGLGTATPGEKLEVNGNLRFSGSTSIYTAPGQTNMVLRSGDGTGNGGSMSIRGGNAGVPSGGGGGDLNLTAGNAMAIGGSGYGGLGPAGNVNISAGQGYNNIGGNLVLRSGGNSPSVLTPNISSKVSLQGIGMNANDGATIDVEGGHNAQYGSPPQYSSGGNVIIKGGTATGPYSGGNIILMAGTGTPNGNVGIGTATPNSNLHVDGTLAVGVTLGVSGGTLASPTVFSAQKSYIGLSPAGSNVYYQLPSAAINAGRVYYIRNNDPSVAAQLGTISGLICPGGGACLVSGGYYTINGSGSVKTVIVISDGINWTVGKLD